MSIVILANNPNFIENKKSLIKKYATDSEIFVSIKLKYVDFLINEILKKHEIFFRISRSNFVFGINDNLHLLNKLKKKSNIYLIINPNTEINFRYSKSPTVEHLLETDFRIFDLDSVINYLYEFKNDPIFDLINKYLIIVDGKIDIKKLSTGFLVILWYSIKYPNDEIKLLGFYDGNQKVLLEGKNVSISQDHNFEDEKRIIQKIIKNIVFIN